jgi:hypothetical protein
MATRKQPKEQGQQAGAGQADTAGVQRKAQTRRARKEKATLVPAKGTRRTKTLEELADEQGVKPVSDFDAFLGGGEDISEAELEEFLEWRRDSRRRELQGRKGE